MKRFSVCILMLCIALISDIQAQFNPTPNNNGLFYNGNVGIGTNSPITKLQLKQSGGMSLPGQQAVSSPIMIMEYNDPNSVSSSFYGINLSGKFNIQRGSTLKNMKTQFSVGTKTVEVNVPALMVKNKIFLATYMKPNQAQYFGIGMGPRFNDNWANGPTWIFANNQGGAILQSSNKGDLEIVTHKGVGALRGNNLENAIKMVVKREGNVGIGTTQPSAQTHIKTNAGQGLIVEHSTTADYSYGQNIMINRDLTKAFAVSNTADGKEKFIIWGNGVVNTGKIYADEIEVKANAMGTSWPDYVFAESYNLKPLSEVAKFISVNKHLPEIPSAQVVEENGINVAEMDAMLLKKIEELTLYLINQNKEIESLREEIKEMRVVINAKK